jgi:guanosine-3',5'-bis(diphosphate) 3'-pyrophosphohydrolase
MVRNRFVIEVGDVENLRHLVTALRHVESVFDAYRVSPGS